MKVYVWLRSNGWRWQTEDHSHGAFGILDRDDAVREAKHDIPDCEIEFIPPPHFGDEARDLRA